MSIIGDHKKIATVIVAKMHDGSDAGEPAAGELSDKEQGLKAACQDAMEAIKAGDAEGFCEALKDFLDIHQEQEGYQDEEYSDGYGGKDSPMLKES